MHVWSGVDHRRIALASDITAADGLLQQSIERQLRLGTERSVLALHLSQLLAPAPGPHHRRIARLVLDDTAQLYGGQVFHRQNADLVIMCDGAVATGLVETLMGLFGADAPSAGHLLSLWTLPQDAARVLAYTEQVLPPPPPAPPPPIWSEPRIGSGAVETIGALIATTRFSDLVRRQTAVHVTASGAHPLYHEVTFSQAALQARVAAMVPAQSDPFLFRHLAARLDTRMLEAIHNEITTGGPLAACRTLHLNLTLQTIHSDNFQRLAQAAHDRAIKLGIEIPLLEACADPGGFAEARAALRAQHCALVLDSVTHPAMLMTTTEALQPDLVKLEWTPRLASLPAREQRQLTTALQRLSVERVVLQRAETEAALAWGRAQGIRRFQGRHVDAMMAASRMTACRSAASCTFRQCIARASATGEAGRAGCGNPALLDTGGVAPAPQP